MNLTGVPITAQEAASYGLVSKVCLLRIVAHVLAAFFVPQDFLSYFCNSMNVSVISQIKNFVMHLYGLSCKLFFDFAPYLRNCTCCSGRQF